MNDASQLAGGDQIVATVLCGQSDREKVTFVPGTPVGPISLGTQGGWKFNAQGVAAHHVYLHFDGRELYACSGAKAFLGGSPLDSNWVRVGPPCELRFEGACIILRKEPPSHAPSYGGQSTMRDGGALLRAAQRAVEAAMKASRPGVAAAPGAAPWPAAMSAPPQADEQPSTARMPHAMGNETLAIPARPAWPGAMPATGARADAPAAQTPAALRRSVGAPAEDAEDAANEAKKAGFWRSASPVKKVTVLLMPLALVGSYFAFFPTEQPAPRTGPVSTGATAYARAAGVASPTGARADAGDVDRGRASPPGFSVAAAPPATPPVSADSPVASAKQPAAPPKTAGRLSSGGRSAEREALDTAAAGSFEEAAKRYETLAAAHPDNIAYKEAARILHAKGAPNGH
jgi:hypothetical protein